MKSFANFSFCFSAVRTNSRTIGSTFHLHAVVPQCDSTALYTAVVPIIGSTAGYTVVVLIALILQHFFGYFVVVLWGC